MHEIVHFPVISRLVPLPPDVAAVVFDLAAADLTTGDAVGTWSVPTPSGLVRFARPPVRRPLGRAYLPLREAHGVLRRGRLLRQGVVLELLPWSARVTELGLRVAPPGRGRAARLRERPYRQVGEEAVEAFARALEEWPSGFLGGLRAPANAPRDGCR